MSTTPNLQVKFVGTQDDIDALASDLRSAPEVTIVSVGKENDPTLQKFGLIEIAAVATIVQLGFYTAELSTKIYAHFQKKGQEKRSLSIQTPFNKVVIESSKDLTEADIKRKLQAALPAAE